MSGGSLPPPTEWISSLSGPSTQLLRGHIGVAPVHEHGIGWCIVVAGLLGEELIDDDRYVDDSDNDDAVWSIIGVVVVVIVYRSYRNPVVFDWLIEIVNRCMLDRYIDRHIDSY